jgi:mono/diheme cytochrome c family protein
MDKIKYVSVAFIVFLFVNSSFIVAYKKNYFQNEPGKETYETFCIACHQADGKGQPGVNPPLVGSDWVKGDKTRLIKAVMQGLNEPIEVNGIKYNNAMPAHDYLEDANLAQLLTYVRNQFGQTTDSVTVAEIKIVRESLK